MKTEIALLLFPKIILMYIPNVTLGLEFFMNKAPISSRSISFVSILVPWLRADKVGWKPDKKQTVI